MKKMSAFLFIIFFLSLGFAHSIFAQGPHYRYYQDPKTDVYFGHISYTEAQLDGKDPIVLRDGKTVPEVAVLNFPIAPGDTIITPGDRRCEIQFDTGTIIRLDTDTEVKIETILAQSLTSQSKLTNFVLNNGQIYVMYKQYSYSEILQILLPNASAKFKHKSVLMMRVNKDGSTNLKVDTGEASVLFGPDGDLEKIDLKRSEEATITLQNEILYSPYEDGVDFSLWNFEMNRNFLALHRGISDLPKPIQRMSPAVFNFAQKFSNLFGEWLWNDIYGYVWRPFTNDRYPSGDWQPYSYGHWRKINENLFWVPQESWGWVPYHLGVWTWDKKTGWLWIPGGAFAPAWASWNFYMGHFTWRPITLFDWLFQGYSYAYIPSNISDGLFTYGQNKYDDPVYSGSSIKKTILNKIKKNQLKNNSSAIAAPSKKIRKVLANLVTALKKGDASILSSMSEFPNKKIVVRGENLSSTSIRKMMLEMDQMSAVIQNGLMARNPSLDPLGYARIAFRQNDSIAALSQIMTVTELGSTGGAAVQNRSIRPDIWISDRTKDRVERQASSEREKSGGLVALHGRLSDLTQFSGRFRDWNPDVKAANRAGVTIKYSSLENAVRIPEFERASGSGGGGSGSFNFSRAGSRAFSSTSSSGSMSSSSSSGNSGSSRSSTSSSSSSRTSTSSSKGSKTSSTKSSSSKTIKKY
ncbi:DUF6600 domain-containing protein [Acidobacteriota bacterium]